MRFAVRSALALLALAGCSDGGGYTITGSMVNACGGKKMGDACGTGVCLREVATPSGECQQGCGLFCAPVCTELAKACPGGLCRYIGSTVPYGCHPAPEGAECVDFQECSSGPVKCIDYECVGEGGM
jgi:hypothetical protein